MTSRFLAAFAVLTLTVACGTSASRQCDGLSCTGCCDADGVCQRGSERNACGSSANACTDCGRGICSIGVCLSPSEGVGSAGGSTVSGGGGAGSGGAGGVAAGGSAAGGAAAGGGAGGGGFNTSNLAFRLFANSIGTHNCALYDSGEVWCWGQTNEYGQIGAGSPAQYPAAMLQVPGLPSNVVSLGLGSKHSCAVTAQAAVWCWGNNSRGQLGDVSTGASSRLPVQVVGLPPVASVALGSNHSCALTTGGAVWCWGSNLSGQLGVTQSGDPRSPMVVPSLASGVKELRLGPSYSCALTNQGTVMCWGSLDGSPASPPMNVGLSGIVSLSVGLQHACASDLRGSMWCWGGNSKGQLGTGGTVSSLVPTPVTGLTDVSSVSSGEEHSCALSATGGVRCWGSQYAGLLGDGTSSTQFQSLPVTIRRLTGVQSLVSGYWANFASSRDAVIVWGNTFLSSYSSPPARASMTPVRGGVLPAIRLGSSDGCALLEAEAWCWGFDDYGALGNGEAPRMVSVGLSRVVGVPGPLVELGVGGDHACALTSTGAVWCWGRNQAGQLGVESPAETSTPVRVTGLPTDTRRLFVGSDTSCVVTALGAVWCWGDGLDQWSPTPHVPALIPFTTPMAEIAVGLGQACARSTAGGLVCWGSFFTPGSGLQTVSLPSPVVSVDANSLEVCAALSNGDAWCWGLNRGGQTGDGSMTRARTPHRVPVTGVKSVAVGSEHACALKLDGTVWCWGEVSKLGRGLVGNTASGPAPVPGLSNIEYLDANSFTTVAVQRDGAVMCFGAGLLGDDVVREPMRCAL